MYDGFMYSMPMLTATELATIRWFWAADTSLDLALVKPVENVAWTKPGNGLWLSPLTRRHDGREAQPAWINFMEEEQWTLYNNTVLKKQEVGLSPAARVLKIDSYGDFQVVLSAYLYLHTDETYNGVTRFTSLLDFEALAEDWDGLYLTENGLNETRRHAGIENAHLDNWDLTSIVLFNTEVINFVSEPVKYELAMLANS